MPLNINFQQILLHMLNFTLLFCVLYFVLYSPVKKFMQKREDYYKELSQKAEEENSEAQKLKASYEEKLTACDEEIKDIKDKAYAELDKYREEQKKLAEKEAQEILTKAHANAHREKADILNSAGEEIRDTVSLAIEKLSLGENADDVYKSFLNSLENGDKQ